MRLPLIAVQHRKQQKHTHTHTPLKEKAIVTPNTITIKTSKELIAEMPPTLPANSNCNNLM